MMMSETIGKLTEALAKAQAQMSFAKKDKANPFFKSNYADLASCIEVSREPLSKNGLAIIQTVGESDQGVIIETLLSHSSGEWVRGKALIPMLKRDPQALGSAVTYGRRYSLCAIINLASDDGGVDDDGEKAMGRGASQDANQNAQIAILSSHIERVKDAPSADAVRKMIAQATDNALKNRAWGALLAKAQTLGLAFVKETGMFGVAPVDEPATPPTE